MSEHEDSLNGDTKIVLFRLRLLTDEVEKLKASVQSLHDALLKMPLPCPAPGTCLDLKAIARDHDDRIRHLEKLEVRVLTSCAIITFAVPLILKYVL